jgi:hypothetical protein
LKITKFVFGLSRTAVYNNSFGVACDFTFKHNSLYASDRRDLTYILGAKYIDGIILIGDGRVTRGSGSYEYEDKIFAEVTNVITGASGIVGLFDKLRREIAVARPKPSIETADFIREAKRIVDSKVTPGKRRRMAHQAMTSDVR